MKMTKKDAGNRFSKIVNEVVNRQSPSTPNTASSPEDEAAAEDQEGKPKKVRPNDPNDKDFY